jgi:hypothetical protein
MSTAILPRPAGLRLWGFSGTGLAVAVVLGAWFALVVLLGAAGGFLTAPGIPPWPIALGFAVPLGLFLVLLRLSGSFREFVLTLDPRLLVAIQAWRFEGIGFLALYASRVLPGMFALPAGLGDIAIGATAPWLVLTLIRQPAFAGSRLFRVWNGLGILDLVVAITAGALGAALATGAPGEIATSAMAQVPLVLFPAYLVPIHLMLHIASLVQGRALRSADPSRNET